MHLVELIATPATRPQIMDDLETFLTSTLGKGVVRAKDTPNFIANRVGIFGMLATIKEAEKYGLSYDVVDDLTGSELFETDDELLPNLGLPLLLVGEKT